MIRNFEKETNNFMCDNIRRRLADYYNNEPVSHERIASYFKMSGNAIRQFLDGGSLDFQKLMAISQFLSRRKY